MAKIVDTSGLVGGPEKKGPPLDHLKISHIRVALWRGAYRADSHAIADAMARYVR